MISISLFWFSNLVLLAGLGGHTAYSVFMEGLADSKHTDLDKPQIITGAIFLYLTCVMIIFFIFSLIVNHVTIS